MKALKSFVRRNDESLQEFHVRFKRLIFAKDGMTKQQAV
jgi:hypothetical protein